MRTAFTLLLGLFLVRLLAETPPVSPVPPAAGTSTDPFAWSAQALESKAEPMARFVTFAFAFTNISSTPASILGTQSSCECTVAELPAKPWILAPGAVGTLHVRMNVVGRFGLVTKVVAVETSHGTNLLTVRARIPLTPAPFNVSPRITDMAAAKKDPQTIFRDGCAACHAHPTIGRKGQELFVKACGICHQAEHRAEMVPDLAQIPRSKDAAYWRGIIVHGKPGTIMPAFAAAEGGILDPGQVDSLVEYLVRAYPPAKTADKP